MKIKFSQNELNMLDRINEINAMQTNIMPKSV